MTDSPDCAHPIARGILDAVLDVLSWLATVFVFAVALLLAWLLFSPLIPLVRGF